MKQQEYQEALDSLRKECKATFVNEKGIRMYSSNKNDDERCNTIQQLIDKLPYWLELEEKEKPMKPIEYDGQIPWVSYNCPNCLWTISSVMKESYCETCGQKIDWSDEE